MNKFERELEKGNFVTSECSKCKEIVWPPRDFCSKCLREVAWRKVQKKGRLIEFSKKDTNRFCIAEFEDKIRILSTLKNSDTEPKIGQELILENCGFKNGNYNFILSMT
jgi:uncharacterized protein